MIFDHDAIAALQGKVNLACTLNGKQLKWQYLPLFVGFTADADGIHYNVQWGRPSEGWSCCAWPTGRPHLAIQVPSQPLADAWQQLNDRI